MPEPLLAPQVPPLSVKSVAPATKEDFDKSIGLDLKVVFALEVWPELWTANGITFFNESNDTGAYQVARFNVDSVYASLHTYGSLFNVTMCVDSKGCFDCNTTPGVVAFKLLRTLGLKKTCIKWSGAARDDTSSEPSAHEYHFSWRSSRHPLQWTPHPLFPFIRLIRWFDWDPTLETSFDHGVGPDDWLAFYEDGVSAYNGACDSIEVAIDGSSETLFREQPERLDRYIEQAKVSHDLELLIRLVDGRAREQAYRKAHLEFEAALSKVKAHLNAAESELRNCSRGMLLTRN